MTERGQVGLYENVAELVRLFEPTILNIKTHFWSGSERSQSMEWLRRSIFIRQYEAVHASLMLCKNNTGHFAVTLVRPGFEELVWLSYLETIACDKPELIWRLASFEVCQGLQRQNDFLGKQKMRDIGFSQSYVKTSLAYGRENEAELKTLAASLGWPKMKKSGFKLPNFFYFAQKVSREDEYKYIYYATSKFVHFSPHELFRRVWGKKGNVEIGSSSFSVFWSDFALYWLARIFVETLVSESENIEILVSDIDAEEITSRIKKLQPVQIITRSELESWN